MSRVKEGCTEDKEKFRKAWCALGYSGMFWMLSKGFSLPDCLCLLVST